jgi:Transglutaminase-like superfamily
MSRLSRSVRAFRGLSWAERWVLAQTLALLPVTVGSLRLLGFRRTKALLLAADSSARRRRDLPAAQALARVVHGAALWSPLPANCLPRALVLCRVLERRGLDAELRLGVDKPDGEFAAHAWVEHGGTALAEPEHDGRRFAPLGEPSLPRQT